LQKAEQIASAVEKPSRNDVNRTTTANILVEKGTALAGILPKFQQSIISTFYNEYI
jgi:hypothetical protein